MRQFFAIADFFFCKIIPEVLFGSTYKDELKVWQKKIVKLSKKGPKKEKKMRAEDGHFIRRPEKVRKY